MNQHATPTAEIGAPSTPSALPSRRAFLTRALAPLGLFLIGFLVLVAIDLLFNRLIVDLDRQTQDERARVLIGEQTVQDLMRLESALYRMASTRGARSQALIARDLHNLIDSDLAKLRVLEQGGMVSVDEPINPGAQDLPGSPLSYNPQARHGQYMLAVLDLKPRLAAMQEKIDVLARMLAARDDAWEHHDQSAVAQANDAVQTLEQALQPAFLRMTEDANHLLTDSQGRLADLNARIQAKKERYRWLEALIVAAVVLVVLALAYRDAYQSELEHRRLAEAQEALAGARAGAESASRSKSVFLANMSHEIRNAMNSITGMASLVLDSNLSLKQRTDVETIQHSANALLGLLNDILDFCRIDARRVRLERGSFDLVELIEDVVRTFSETSRRSGVALYYHIAPDFPRAAVGDAQRLRQILVNLVDNAFKFTSSGSVRIDAELEAERAGRVTLRFQVADTGIGIDKEHQSSIFFRFTEADEAIYRKHGGAGLGLTIAERLAELMDGRLWVESEPGKGSRFQFTVRLPRAEDPPGQDVGAQRRTETTASPRAQGVYRILLVEDDHLNSAITRRVLEKDGHSVTEAVDGEAALQALAAQTYDLVLMDVQMPNMDGLEATRILRALETGRDPERPELVPEGLATRLRGQRIPVIAMTANALAGDRELCLSAGTDDYVTKPFNRAEMLATVQRVMNQRSGAVQESAS